MDAYLDMQNSEKRVLEDRVYQLEYDYEKALKELKACRAKLGIEDKDGAKGNGSKTGKEKKKTLPEIIPEDSQEPPKVELPPGFNEPDGKQTSTTPKRRGTADRAEGKVALASASTDAEPESEPEAATTDDAQADATERVDYIFLNPRLTRGQDFDQQPGDDGLGVLVEPRSKEGHFVPQPAKVSIVLLDPAKKGAGVRVARWDFDKELAAKLLRDAPLDRGIYFRMPWPKNPPEHERLQLFVRYWCEDGRKLEASREITLRLPSRTASAWTRRTDPPEPDPRPAASVLAAQTSAKPEPIQVTPVGVSPPAAASSSSPASPATQPSLGSPEQPSLAERPGRFWKPTR